VGAAPARHGFRHLNGRAPTSAGRRIQRRPRRRPDAYAPQAFRFKPLVATIQKRLVLRKLGRLEAEDRLALRGVLGEILGQ